MMPIGLAMVVALVAAAVLAASIAKTSMFKLPALSRRTTKLTLSLSTVTALGDDYGTNILR